MKKENKTNKVFLAALLASSLVMYNYPILSVQAEGENASSTPPQEEPVCGNGTLEDGEECDDGNSSDGDGCSAACIIEEEPQPVCGNGTLEDGEECDDSNTEDGDGCSALCVIEQEPESGGDNDENATGTTEINITGGESSSSTPSATSTQDDNNDQNSSSTEEEGSTTGEEGDGNEEGQDSTIVTGDAEGDVEVGNEVNTNDTDVEDCCSCEEECPCWQEPECDCTCDCETEVSNDNDAEVGNDIDLEGDTGDNTASSNSGDSTILTGDANLVVGLVNTVNTNIINSDFSNFLFNIFGFLAGDINLSDLLDESFSNNNSLSTTECLDVNNENDGTIDNDIVIDGSTGSNTAESQDGDATIITGDVNASANIFNLLNTNIISSNWTNLMINVFDDWVGDLVLPGQGKISDFLNQGTACLGSCGTSITNSNEGGVNNDVSINADTGSNDAASDSSTIITGDANAETEIFNMVNTNSVGGKWLLIAINVFGDWKGNIFSLPAGLGAVDDMNGVNIYNLDSENFDEPTGGNTTLNVVNDNTGFIQNSILVNVSTGDNSAESENGEATIITGNANVMANLVNILNSNLIGSNWLMGMINIFGNWQGNLAFGRPDLWVGESAVTVSNPARVGSSIKYTLTYMNNGDADATDVKIFDDFDEDFISIKNAGGGTIIDNPGEIMWNIGTVPAGESGSVSYTVDVGPEVPPGSSYITNQSSIDSYEDDWNDEDNNDSLSVEVYYPIASLSSGLSGMPHLAAPNLQITKTSNVEDFIYASSTVDYSITLENNSSAFAYNVVVTDNLVNESLDTVNSYSWDLGQVFPNEEIVINYTLFLGGGIPAGLYTNTAKAIGFDGHGNAIESDQAFTTIELRREDGSEQIEELSIEEMMERLDEIKAQIKMIQEEIGRITPEPRVGDILDSIPEVLGSEVLAAEESSAQEGTDFFKNLVLEEQEEVPEASLISFFLANLGMLWNGIASLASLGIILILFLIVLSIFVSNREKLFSNKKKGRKK
jgi:uncharacterized repeat protein (TIGR01451 family)